MSSVKKFEDKDVELRYHPQENIIDLRLKSRGRKDVLSRLEDKIKTVLSVDSTKIQPNQSRIIQLDKQSPEGVVQEFLQTMLGGGEEIEDAQAVGSSSAKEEEEKPQPPMPAPPAPVPMVPGPEQQFQPEQEMQPESFTPLDAFSMLWESTYRTGDYWDLLTQATGKGRQQFEYFDILSLRRSYSKKKKSESRDKILRALDRAARYFVRFLRKSNGNEAALNFKNKYKSIGKLTPHDYGSDGGIDGASEPEQNVEFDPRSIDFSSFFPNSEQDDEDQEENEEEIHQTGREEYPV